MKICITGSGIAIPAKETPTGAHVNNIATISKKLTENGHEVHIVTSYHPPYSPSTDMELHFAWATVHPVRVNGRYSSIRYGLNFIRKTALEIRRLHKEEKFDVIHGHSGYLGLALLTGISSRLNNIPSVHTLYCPVERSSISLSAPFFSKFYLWHVNMVVAISESVRRSLRGVVPDNKIRVIPPCIDLTLFRPGADGREVRRNFQLDDKPVLLYLGNVSEEKGAEVLVEALAIVTQSVPDVRLLMVLDPSIEMYRPETQRRRLKLSQQIEFHHLGDNVIMQELFKDIPQVMAASDIFITPFLKTKGPADYPLSLLEAMAVGKPVVATKVGGIPELMKDGENGILVDLGDVRSLAEAIVFLLGNKGEGQKMGEKGRRFVEANFSVERVMRMTEEVYAEVIKGKGRACSS